MISDMVIPDGALKIDFGTFSDCEKLESILIPVSVKDIGEQAFFRCKSLSAVFYLGAPEEFKAIRVESGNECFKTAKKYFYQEEKPQRRGKHWHYVDGVPTLW